MMEHPGYIPEENFGQYGETTEDREKTLSEVLDSAESALVLHNSDNTGFNLRQALYKGIDAHSEKEFDKLLRKGSVFRDMVEELYPDPNALHVIIDAYNEVYEPSAYARFEPLADRKIALGSQGATNLGKAWDKEYKEADDELESGRFLIKYLTALDKKIAEEEQEPEVPKETEKERADRKRAEKADHAKKLYASLEHVVIPLPRSDGNVKERELLELGADLGESMQPGTWWSIDQEERQEIVRAHKILQKVFHETVRAEPDRKILQEYLEDQANRAFSKFKEAQTEFNLNPTDENWEKLNTTLKAFEKLQAIETALFSFFTN